MLLGRLRIRGKLTLLVAIPLLAMLGLLVPQVTSLVSTASRASDTDVAATVTGQFGVLVEDLQQERLLSIGYLLGAADESTLARQSAEVTDQVIEVRRNLGDRLSDETRAALEVTQQLTQLRQRVRARSATPDEVLDAFVPVLDGMIDSLGLVELADAASSTGRELLTLDALLRMNESLTESTAMLAIMADGDADALSLRYHEEVTERSTYEDRFTAFATPTQTQLYALVSTAFQQRLGDTFDEDFDLDPVATMRARPLAALFPSLQSFSVLGAFVEKRLIDDLSAAVSRQERRALTLTYAIGIGAPLLLLIVLVLVAAVGRAVAGPLIRLTRSAERVAEAGEQELRRIADDEVEGGAPVRIDTLDVSSNDEIGELARAFDRLQSTATQLVERQVLGRRNVAQMFGHIGRRTQNLVGRQVGLIDALETQETDGPRLQQLYRLDHLSNRLRRTADSLVVISGTDRGEDHIAPVRLMDVGRLALAEIEDYTRVDVDVPLDLMAAPAVVSDLVLVVGELLENATMFSPPHVRVVLTASAVPGGARVVVIDRGIGMSEERLAEENARFTRRERLDLVPTRVLGLFVVGRVARRHGFGVVLSHTPGGGITATVEIDDAHLAGGRAAGGHSAGHDRRDPAAAPTPGVAELEAMLKATSAHEVGTRHPAGVQRSTTYRSSHGAAEPAPSAALAAPAAALAAPAAAVVAPNAAVVAPAAAEPAPSAVAPYAPGLTRRAGESMGDWRPWNAFDVGPRSLPAGPAHELPPPATFDPGPPAGRRAADVAPDVGPTAPTPADESASPVRTSQSGLRQRVPGRQLPATPATTSPATMAAGASGAPPSPAEAIVARDLVEAFETGVRRAEEVTGVRPVLTDPAAGAAPPSWPLMPPADGPSAPPAPGQVQPPVGARTLRRRTPGATLAKADAPARPPHPARSAADQDPDAVRSLVEQFESGVARALRDASAGTDTEEGTSG